MNTDTIAKFFYEQCAGTSCGQMANVPNIPVLYSLISAATDDPHNDYYATGKASFANLLREIADQLDPPLEQKETTTSAAQLAPFYMGDEKPIIEVYCESPTVKLICSVIGDLTTKELLDIQNSLLDYPMKEGAYLFKCHAKRTIETTPDLITTTSSSYWEMEELRYKKLGS